MNMAVNTGKAVKGIPWEDGAVSNGRWAGIPLRDVLLYAGVKLDPSSPNAHVQFANLDKCQDDDYYGGSIPLDKALDEDGDVLLATDVRTINMQGCSVMKFFFTLLDERYRIESG